MDHDAHACGQAMTMGNTSKLPDDITSCQYGRRRFGNAMVVCTLEPSHRVSQSDLDHVFYLISHSLAAPNRELLYKSAA